MQSYKNSAIFTESCASDVIKREQHSVLHTTNSQSICTGKIIFHLCFTIKEREEICVLTYTCTRPICTICKPIITISDIVPKAGSRKEDTGGLGGAGGTIKPSSILAVFCSPITFTICIANQCI